MRMKISAALACALLVPAMAAAESHEEGSAMPPMMPVDTYTCDYVDGKGLDDLMEVVKEFNDWADDEDITDYYAALVMPQFFGERMFDVGWLGASADGDAMGSVMESWVTEGGEVGAMFNEVIDCTSHTQFASMAIRPPADPEDEDDNRFVLTFTNCSARDETTFGEVMGGLDAWVEYSSANGFDSAIWMMFPIYGESNDDYDFKVVEGFDDYLSFGNEFELMGNGGHWAKSAELLEPLLDCDIARVYDGVTIRRMEADD